MSTRRGLRGVGLASLAMGGLALCAPSRAMAQFNEGSPPEAPRTPTEEAREEDRLRTGEPMPDEATALLEVRVFGAERYWVGLRNSRGAVSCRSACVMSVMHGFHTLTFTGPGEFREDLAVPRGRSRLDIHPGDRARRVTAITLLSVGASFATTGLIMGLLALGSGPTGLILLASGLVPGIALMTPGGFLLDRGRPRVYLRHFVPISAPGMPTASVSAIGVRF